MFELIICVVLVIVFCIVLYLEKEIRYIKKTVFCEAINKEAFYIEEEIERFREWLGTAFSDKTVKAYVKVLRDLAKNNFNETNTVDKRVRGLFESFKRNAKCIKKLNGSK